MEMIIFSVSSVICAECSLALKRFIGSIKGVKAVVVVNKNIIVDFDGAEIIENEIIGIAENCIEKLGYELVVIKPVQ